MPSDEGSSAAGTLIAPGTLVVGGTAIPYRDVRGGATPSSGGGLWLGSDAVDDGSWGYFVGHNPRLVRAGALAVLGRCRRRVRPVGGRSARLSTVEREVSQVEEDGARGRRIASRVTGYGESVVLQTCAGDGMNVIVVAA